MKILFIVISFVTLNAYANFGAVSSGGENQTPRAKIKSEITIMLNDQRVNDSLGVAGMKNIMRIGSEETRSPKYEILSYDECKITVNLIYPNPRHDLVKVDTVGSCL